MAFTAVAAVTAAYSGYNANQQKQQQKGAQYQAQQAAKKQQAQAEQEINAANKKRPDTMGLISDAAQKSKSGQSGTMLTGPQGVDPASLSLSKNTLLGG